MEILENLICLNLEGTLAYETGIMLNEAEKYYGQRNLNYTLLGFEFSSRDIDYSPCIRYHNTTQIIINLTKSCAQDRYQSIFQMSHEIIHVLGPSGNDSSTVLEEGLATHFQFLYMKNFHDYNMI